MNSDDDDLEVTFLRPSKTLSGIKSMFKWPSPPVILYVSRKDVICRIEETKVVGRSFKITDDGAKTIQEK